ncbi:MAG: hypothetical protein ACKOYG_00865, partial [Ilumatobacteraceae bacterium]
MSRLRFPRRVQHLMVIATLSAAVGTACTDESDSSDTTAPSTTAASGVTSPAPTESTSPPTTALPERALDRVRPPEASTVAELL